MRWFQKCAYGKKVSDKYFISSRDGPVGMDLRAAVGRDGPKGKNKAGMRKLDNTTLLQNDGGLLSGLLYTTKWTRDVSALRWRLESRPPSFRSRVVLSTFLIIPALFLSFLQVHPYLEWSSFKKLFSLVHLRFSKSTLNPDYSPYWVNIHSMYVLIFPTVFLWEAVTTLFSPGTAFQR